MPGKKIARLRAVQAFDSLGNVRGEWLSLQEAQQATGAFPQAICRALRRPGELSSAGFFWRDWENAPKPKAKRCPRCGVELALSEFRHKTGGRRTYCGPCSRASRNDDRLAAAAREKQAIRAVWELHLGTIELLAGIKRRD